ncbi:hypothetical protein Salat_2500700 [Sesamum alatum]|uniref:Uncharacterized protein n=1 Tax=Sesamum alatum TaxID=300844 RepID=A0AAE1XRL6_9LAMI|nr:hypothetical protein Salat_2500700 [Sesamum alatum]
MDPRASSFNMRQAIHHSDVETLSLQLDARDDGARSRERETKLVDEREALQVQIVEKDGQVAALTLENEVVRASTVQAYTRGREEGASSAVAAFKNSHEYVVELS